MILDSSAVVAIYLREPGFESFRDAIEQANSIFIGAPTVVETTLVLSRHLGQDARTRVFGLLEEWGVEILPFTERHAIAASAAFLRYGRGHHPAKLNFGDCMSYAVAVEAGMPLLFKGGDFAKTDVRPAL